MKYTASKYINDSIHSSIACSVRKITTTGECILKVREQDSIEAKSSILKRLQGKYTQNPTVNAHGKKIHLWIDEISVFENRVNAVSIATDSHLKQGWCHNLLLPSTMKTQQGWPTDRVKVSHPIQRIIAHSRDALPSRSLGY